MAELLPLYNFTIRRLEKYNIPTLQQLCRREGLSWRGLPRPGRKKTFIDILMAHKDAEMAIGNGNIAELPENPPARPANLDHSQNLLDFIAAHGVPSISNINIDEEEDDNVPMDVDEDGGDGVVGNGGLGQNIVEDDDMKNIVDMDEKNQVNEEKEAMNEFLVINGLGLYGNALFDDGFDAIDIIAACEPGEFAAIILKAGHRIKLVKRAQAAMANKENVENEALGGGGGIIGRLQGGGLGGGDLGAGGPNNIISNVLQMEHDGALISCALFGAAGNISELRVLVERARSARVFNPITQLRNPHNNKKVNGGHKAAKAVAVLLSDYGLVTLTNIYDPVVAALEAPRGRGGRKWFSADIGDKKGLSVAYNLLSAEKQVRLKENLVKRYKKWIDWKRYGLKMGDHDAVVQLFGDVL